MKDMTPTAEEQNDKLPPIASPSCKAAMGSGDECCPTFTATCDETDGGLEKVSELFGDIVRLGERGVKRIFKPFCVPFSEAANEEDVGNTVFVSGKSIPRQLGIHLIRDARGHKIGKVFNESLAHHAHLRESDIITHLNGEELCSKNLIKVHELFLDVESEFSLKILREVEIRGNYELVEYEITITINFDTTDSSVEVVVTSSGLYILPVGVTYNIAQDPINEPQVFMQSNPLTGKIVMRSQRGNFELVPVACLRSHPEVNLYILRDARTKKALKGTTMNMEPFHASAVEDFLFDVTKLGNNRHVFRRANCHWGFNSTGQDQGGRFLTNVNGEITLKNFGSATQVKASGVFDLFEVPRV